MTPITTKIIRDRAALPMIALTLPIVLEQFFRVLVSSVDTVMLSSYSQLAVAAVGLVAQYIFSYRSCSMSFA